MHVRSTDRSAAHDPRFDYLRPSAIQLREPTYPPSAAGVSAKCRGNASQRWPDDQVFAYAQKEARIPLTHNRKHFKRLHRQNQPHHFGIVICTTDYDFVGMA
jgi:hypothetical protein